MRSFTQSNGNLPSPVKTCPTPVSNCTQPRNKSGSRPTSLNRNFSSPASASSQIKNQNNSPGPKSSSATSSPTSGLTPTGKLPRLVSGSSNHQMIDRNRSLKENHYPYSKPSSMKSKSLNEHSSTSSKPPRESNLLRMSDFTVSTPVISFNDPTPARESKQTSILSRGHYQTGSISSVFNEGESSTLDI